MRKSVKTCAFEGCKNPRNQIRDIFCGSHIHKVTIGRFLCKTYAGMSSRVRGKATKRPDLYLGLPILPKDVFITWSKNNSDFLMLYKRWYTSGFDRRLSPTVNRKNSNKGYTLTNIEWMTNSQNCGLSGEVLRMNRKKAVYDLLGVTNVKK